MEVILLYIVMNLLYIHTDMLPPILPFLFLTGVGAILITLLLSLMKTNTPYVFIMLVVPLLALVSSEMGVGFGESLVIAAVVCYRVIVHFHKTPKLTEAMILNGSLLIGGLIYFAARVQGYIYSDIVLYLLLSQLLFFFIGKIGNNVVNSSLVMKKIDMRKQSWSVFGLISGLFVSAIALAVVFPIVFAKVLSLIMSIVGNGLYFISRPLFNAVEDIDSSRRTSGESVGTLNWEDTEQKNPFLAALGSFDIWFYLSIIGLIILALLVFLVARKRFIKEPIAVVEAYEYSTVTESISTTSRKWIRPKRQTPQAKVRKLLLELEVLASQYDLGRYHYESVTEWLGRTNFLDTRLTEMYGRVRYGDEELSTEENLACEEIVKQLKEKIKSLKRTKRK